MPEARVTHQQKEDLYQRADGRCEYCKSPAFYAPDPFSVEHIQLRAAGGATELPNLAFSRQGCNNFKHMAITALDPATGNEAPLFHPRRDRWADHFTWSEDMLRIVGLTPAGRTTLSRLQLDRAGVVNLRRLLSTVGEHPPDAE